MPIIAAIFFCFIAMVLLKRATNKVSKTYTNFLEAITYFVKVYPIVFAFIVLFFLGLLSITFMKLAIYFGIGVGAYYAYLSYKEKNENTVWGNKKPEKEVSEKAIYDQLLELSQYLIENENAYDNKYLGDDIPIGRTAAFLSYFNKSIYEEDTYFIALNYSDDKNDMREYGYLITGSGIYYSNKNTNNFVPFAGLKDCKSLEVALKFSYIDRKTLNTMTMVLPISKNIEELETISNKINNIYKSGYSRYLFYIEYQFENENLLENRYSGESDSINSQNEEYQDNEIYDDSISKEEAYRVNGKEHAKTIYSNAGLAGSAAERQKIYNENKGFMDGDRGHGYAAEYGNNVFDKLAGKKVINAAQNLDENGRQVKNGADKIVNGTPVQTKYYQSASETIGAAFEHHSAKYIYQASDGSTQMMQIEVPRDQYNESLKLMQKRIDRGEVPGAKPGDDPRKYVKKGFFSYDSACCAAQSGTIQGLTIDLAQGAICASGAAGISALIMFAQSLWNGRTLKEAMGDSMQVAVLVLGKGAVTYTITMQLSRKNFANLLKRHYTSTGKKAGYENISNPIYKFSDNVANKISNSTFANSSIGEKIGLNKLDAQKMISGGVMVVIIYGPDTIRAIQGKISGKQLFKNSMVATGGVLGAVVGTAIVPGVGGIIGGAIGSYVTKFSLDGYIKDDAIEMYNILKTEYVNSGIQAALSSEEMEELCKVTLQHKKVKKMLQNMYQSGVAREYAKNAIFNPVIQEIISKRMPVTNEMYDQAMLEMLEDF